MIQSPLVYSLFNGMVVRIVLPLTSLLILGACKEAQVESPQAELFSGQYTAVAESGQAIQFVIEESSGAIQVNGTVNGKQFAGAAPKVTVARGSMMSESGQSTTVDIIPSSDGKTLSINSPDFGNLLLNKTEFENQLPVSGNLSGVYQATESEAQIAELTIRQSGKLFSGSGEVLGSPVGFTGREDPDGRLSGQVLYRDGTRSGVVVQVVSATEIEVKGLGGLHRMIRQ